MSVSLAAPAPDDPDAVPAPKVRTFLGHPLGLGFLVFAEAWERFSYYGMQALLVLYMGSQLLRPGHVEHVAGFSAFRAGLERVYGPMTPAALASVIFGLYAGGVYLTPLAGGFIADRVLGRTKTIVFGALVMTLGHFLMAFEVAFLPALACLLIGVGCFKGNIASQVGELYAPGDLRRADAFQVFYIGINVAVIISPLICGTLGEEVAWHWGFGAAGIGMVLGLVVYLSGRRWLPPDPGVRGRGRADVERPRLAKKEFVTIGLLLVLLVPMALAISGNMEIFNAYLIWGGDNYRLQAFGQTLPTSWLISLDAIVSAGMLVVATAFWRWLAAKGRDFDEIVKLTIGAFIAAFAPLILAAASAKVAATHEKVGLLWGVAFHLVNDAGVSILFPVGLALYSRASPKAIVGLMIGIYYLMFFGANMLVGWLGGRLPVMGGTAFWMLHAGLVAAGGVVMLLYAVLFRRMLAPTVDPEAAV